MPIYRKGDDLFPLRKRAEQERQAESGKGDFEKQEAGRHLAPENIMLSPWGRATNYYKPSFDSPWKNQNLINTPISGRSVAEGRKREKSANEAKVKYHGAGVIKAGNLVKGSSALDINVKRDRG